MKPIGIASVLAALAIAGCGSDPVDVTGEYTVNVVNRDNGCEFEDWDGGNAQNIPVTLTQDGESATAIVEGLTGGYLDLILGGHEFNGSVDGNELTLTLIGERSANQGNCAYTFDAVIEATLEGNTLEGTISYLARTNDQPDCGTLSGCASVQELNGLRPPPN